MQQFELDLAGSDGERQSSDTEEHSEPEFSIFGLATIPELSRGGSN